MDELKVMDRSPYYWTAEMYRVFGDPFSTFCDLDLLHSGVNAIGDMSKNPCLYDSCYDPETPQILAGIEDDHRMPTRIIGIDDSITFDEVLAVLSNDELGIIKDRISAKRQGKTLQKVNNRTQRF